MTTSKSLETKIKPTTIAKVTDYLNEMAQIIAAKKGKIKTNPDCNRLCDKYSLPYSYFKLAKKLKYFIFIPATETYMFIRPIFEPIHARELICAYKQSRIESNKKYSQKKVTKGKKNEQQNESAPSFKNSKTYKLEPPKRSSLSEQVDKLKEVMEKVPDFTPPKKQYKSKRVFSLFWGLIKFNY